MPYYFRLALACLFSMTLALETCAGQRIWVALAEEGGPYAEAGAELQSALGGSVDLTVRRAPVLFDGKSDPPDLLVTVGLSAFDETLRELERRGAQWARVPVLATLLPQHAYEARVVRLDKGGRPVSAALLDQPAQRQIALLKLALPERRHVGVLYGPQSSALMGALQREARARNLSFSTQQAEAQEAIYPALKRLLDEVDLLLAVPEPAIYNPATLQNILLTTYRLRIPVLAFSAAYVKAGAVLAVYSTPAQVARRAVEMIQTWRAGRGLPPPQLPREFAVAVNAKVATSLGLDLDEASRLQEELRQLEGLK